MKEHVVILGAGPAGLASAYYLEKKGYKVTVIEKSDGIGGLSKGVSFLDLKYDLGPHSFYSNYNEGTKQFFKAFIGEKNYSEVKPEKLIQTKYALFSAPFKISSVFRKRNFLFFTAYAFFKLKALFTFSRNKTIIDKHGYWLREKIFAPYCVKYFNIEQFSVSDDFIELLYANTNSSKSGNDRIYIPHAGYIGKLWENVYDYLLQKQVVFEFNQDIVNVKHQDYKIVRIKTRNKIFDNINQVISTIPLPVIYKLIFPDKPLGINLKYRASIIVFIEVVRIKTKALYLTNYDLGNRVGRISFCSNWKKEKGSQVISCEIWCDEKDAIFNCSDEEIMNTVIKSLSDVLCVDIDDDPKYKVIKLAKCFPVLEKGYKDELIKTSNELKSITNLKPLGRHGKFQWDGIDDVIQSAGML